ncbi:S9 family peptidase [Niabella terrae]
MLRYLYGWLLLTLLTTGTIQAQRLQWTPDGSGYYRVEAGSIVQQNLATSDSKTLFDSQKLIPEGAGKPITIKQFSVAEDASKLLIFTNTRKVWRYETRGDYWVYDRQTEQLKQLGKTLPEASLMFAKLSPDGTKAAYVSQYNLYVEDLSSGEIRALSKDGDRKNIYGTFDWAYEEEFSCRDGFRWASDSKQIAFWKIITGDIKVYNMVNNTDSIYPKIIPIEYPVAGEKPSAYKIGVVSVEDGSVRWMEIADDPQWGSYLPRMEWAANNAELILQQLNRQQNESRLLLCQTKTGSVKNIYTEQDAAWIDILPAWDHDYENGGWDWLRDGREFLWASEKDGWRHLYRISRDGKKETLVTKGAYDVMDIAAVDEAGGWVYFHASPENATQQYLYRTALNGKGTAQRLTPAAQPGNHRYQLSPDGRFALHNFSNHYIRPVSEWISLPGHQGLNGSHKVGDALAAADSAASQVSFLKITTEEGITMDAWMARPPDFDPAKKYPVVFYVYTEPAGQTVKDNLSAGHNFLYPQLVNDGYIYVSVDGRGTPAPKGRDWRKSIYKQIGRLNIHDQAMAARQILKLPYIDSSRVAVWGWSGGGSTTLNLLFQYPEIYKTGIAIAAVGNQLTYDNIYQERYSGVPSMDPEPYTKGSPLTYAKNLRGNLLYIHGTGDDNVHYNNAEMLINELIRYNKQFQMMSYPNRTHSISEGAGTFEHLSSLFTNYLRQHCPPGGR